MIRIVPDSSELDRICESYKEERRKLQKQLDSTNVEIHRLGSVYEKCRNLWMNGEFQLLSEALDNEGCRFLQDLSKKLIWLRGDANTLQRALDRLNTELEEGIVCPRCDGIGKIAVEKHYERSEKQIVPIVRMQECSFCKGTGRLLPHQPL